jgi:DNA polymerase I
MPQQITVEEGTRYTSIRGEALRRLYTQRPTDVREVRDRFRHFEADIPFATRFMIDTGLTGGLEAPGTEVPYQEAKPAVVNAPARMSFMDIECEDVRGFPDPQRDAIICITCWDSFDEDYVTFFFAADGKVPDLSGRTKTGGLPNGCFREGRHTVCAFATEAEMLNAFVKYVQERDRIFLSGWNFVEFDMPYITARMEKLGIVPTVLARLPGQTERTALRGRAVFDLLQAYKKMHSTQKESYRLDAIAEEELGERKVRYTGTLSNLWREDPGLLIEYNFKDVDALRRHQPEEQYIEFYREIARYVGCPLDRTLNSSNVVDIFVLRKASGKYVLPSKGYAAADEFEGATVL